MIRSPGVILLALAVIAGAFATFVAVTGGIDTRIASIPVRSRSWERPAILGVVLVIGALISLRLQIAAAASRFHARTLTGTGRAARLLPALAVCWTVVAALAFGTFAAGGADSYGYISQAELLASGRLIDATPMHQAFTWPDVTATLTPLGYTRGTTATALAPTYPPGLPLLMAPFVAIHSRAVFLIVPFCAGVTIFCCWALGRELHEPLAGSIAACLLALSPTFLYQAVQPMSDVPVTACWMGALLLARRSTLSSASAAGAIASVAILIRPNLAPLGIFVIAASATAADRLDWRRAVGCAAAMVPGIAALGAIQNVRYGSPLGSGYGSFNDLFSLRNVSPNLARYPRWLTATHTGFIWLWIFAPLWIARAARMDLRNKRPPERREDDTGRRVRSFGWICYGFCAAVMTAYLPYVYFRPEEWFYTRFLLPALPLMLLLAIAVTLTLARQFVPRAADAATIALAVALAVAFGVKAARVGTFGLRGAEHKYPAAGAFVKERLPASALVFAMQHSGSIRYYSGRYTLRWDVLDREWLDRTISALRSAGYEPFAVLDADEDREFRRRFASAAQRSLERMSLIATIGPTNVYAFR